MLAGFPFVLLLGFESYVTMHKSCQDQLKEEHKRDLRFFFFFQEKVIPKQDLKPWARQRRQKDEKGSFRQRKQRVQSANNMGDWETGIPGILKRTERITTNEAEEENSKARLSRILIQQQWFSSDDKLLPPIEILKGSKQSNDRILFPY